MSLFSNEQAVQNPKNPPRLSHDDGAEIRVRKRNGQLVPVDSNKILAATKKHCHDLLNIDIEKVTQKAINGPYDGVGTEELDSLLIQVASMMIGEDPDYSKLAARLLDAYIADEVATLKILSFSSAIEYGYQEGLIAKSTQDFVQKNQELLDKAITPRQSSIFEYFGLRTVYDRYLLKDPKSRTVIETPQYFFMRVACGLAHSPAEAMEFYALLSAFEYMPSTPTLFNSATLRPQMSSCYLLDSPQDSLESIYDKYKDVALLSKFAGGIGLAYSRIRSQGSLIKGTNGKSNGIIPFLKTLDSSVSAVNQGGKRKGAACIYLETWHADLLDFLKLRDNAGDEAMRTHNLNTANWIPDLFMERVENDGMWSFFDPADVPEFTDLYGKEFEKKYEAAEAAGLYKSQQKAREIYSEMMRCLAQTGNGWMTFKDSSNLKANQTGVRKENVIHLSNLCTEILEVTSKDETAVCNLGSLNLAKYVKDGAIDYEKLRNNAKIAVKYLDRVIDINFYPTDTAVRSNSKWRPVGLGLMGLQDAFFELELPFDSAEAKEISRRVQEEIYFAALEKSCELAQELGPFEAFEETKTAKGLLQHDLWQVTPSNAQRFEELKKKIAKYGLRNSLLVAIAPTATIASICGSYECIEPMVSNLFKRETLSGEFIQVNGYLVRKLKQLGLWGEKMRNQIKEGEGSIQQIDEIPTGIKELFRTVWEVPMRSIIDMAADRGPYIDQSQSVNLFIESPTIGKLSSMYNYAWKKGLKTTYYLRSRAATKINKTTTSSSAEAIACSLENPETCESCQ